MPNKRGQCLTSHHIFPGAVEALHRHPEYADIFPIGASLAQWATWSA